MKRALITGINGQDGSYLCELLLRQSYEVHGILRPSSFKSFSRTQNISGLSSKVILHPSEITDQQSIYNIVSITKPDECYHLAASSFVDYDFDKGASLISTNISSTHYLLSALHDLNSKCRFYFAASSELFGNAAESPQNEHTAFNPRSAYGVSKLASFHLVKNYRERHQMFACSGITYNHESPRRGFEYVTRKISRSAAEISLGIRNSLTLGNLSVIRDWGYAPDYVEAMWKMLNAEKPNDYVISTGIGRTLTEVLEIAFGYLGKNYQDYVISDPKFFRPSESIPLIGDSRKIRKDLGWLPKMPFQKMIEEMVAQDLAHLQNASSSGSNFVLNQNL